MTHSWFKNTDDINFNINTKNLTNHLTTLPYTLSDLLICFSHVPKTGGTSLESILAKNFLLSETLHINAPDLNRQLGIISAKKNHPKLVCGHHPIHGLLYQLLPEVPVFHFTQLRHPVDRVLSYFNYVLGKTDHPMHSQATGKSILEFLETAPSPELSNGQAKRFSGYLHHGQTDDESLFRIAQKTLTECFSMVLTTCLFDESLLLLKKRLGLKDIYYQRSNVSQKFISQNQLSTEELQVIESMNQADLKLFHWARARCLDLVEDELTAADISKFRVNNQKWAELVQS